jgi:hypothetical protein
LGSAALRRSGTQNRRDCDVATSRSLQAIITRIEQQEFQIRGWLLLILSALLAAVYSEKIKLNRAAFGSVSALLTVFFAFAELVVRVPKRKAIWRVDDVEEALRGEKPYDGPRITASIAPFWDQKTLTELMRNDANLSGFSTAIFGCVRIRCYACPGGNRRCRHAARRMRLYARNPRPK